MKRYATVTVRVRLFADDERGLRRAMASLRSDCMERLWRTNPGWNQGQPEWGWEKIGKPKVVAIPHKTAARSAHKSGPRSQPRKASR